MIDSIERRDAKLCGLTRRWHLLSNVFRQAGLPAEQWSSFWNQVMLKSPSTEQSAVGHELRSIVSLNLDRWLNATRGALFSSRSPGMGASALGSSVTTLVASILSWHFERVALIAKPGEIQLPVNLWQDLLKKHPMSNSLILVDAPKDLWNASKLEAMEAVIAFAYERKIPIWIHSMPGTETSETTGEMDHQRKTRSFKQSISKRLEGVKGKSPFEWLSRQSLSRLSEICDVPVADSPEQCIPDFI